MYTCYREVPRWGVQEIVLQGPADDKAFDRDLIGRFTQAGETTEVSGFYDGDGRYIVRFMPSREGLCTFCVRADFLAGDAAGEFTVTPAEAGVHGPVRVSDTYHFACEDGTHYMPVGTTCYVWHLQTPELCVQTLDTLASSPFNKLRFCVFPKHYDYNHNEPFAYPFEALPPEDGERFCWDYARFNPAYFRHLEWAVTELGRRGVQADIIVLHPYDRWGFSRMTRQQDERYARYLASRLSAFHNVWWSLANEYDLMPHKSQEDWAALAQALRSCDPYAHLMSNHNCVRIYDAHLPWITHCCIQHSAPEMLDAWRREYGKPVIVDELGYEGNIQHGWGSLTAEEEVRRFWDATLQGGYAGHGETYLHEQGILWWSHGGVLHGQAPARLAFLRDFLDSLPGPLMRREANWDERCATLQGHTETAPPILLYYTYHLRPAFREYTLPEGTAYRVEVLDTWNMTRTDCGVMSGHIRVNLPARPYIAVYMQRVR